MTMAGEELDDSLFSADDSSVMAMATADISSLYDR